MLGLINLQKLKLKVIIRVNVVVLMAFFVAAKIRRVVIFWFVLNRSKVEIGFYDGFQIVFAA